MLRHEFIAVQPDILDQYEMDYCFFRAHRENSSLIREWMTLDDDAVLANYGFKRSDFRVTGMTAENFFPELMKFFSSFSACTPEGQKTIGLSYWGITLLKTETLLEIVQRGGRTEFAYREEMLKFVKFCAGALREGLWVVHFGV